MYFTTIFLVLVTMCNFNYIAAVGNTVSQIGDTIYCGTIVCPKDSVNCKVITRNDPKNPKIIITNEVCKDDSGNVLKENSYKTNNPSGGIVSEESGVGPEYAAEAAENAALIYQQNLALQQQIQQQIQQQFQHQFPFPFPSPFNPFRFK